MSERLDALCEAAEQIEKLRKTNPMNGDGSNYTLTKALDAIVRLAGNDWHAVTSAVATVRDNRAAAELALYERLRAEESA